MGTPIFDQLRDEIWPPRPVTYLSDEKFRRIFDKEATRWADLSGRLKAAGD